jgi:hypothetical protein
MRGSAMLTTVASTDAMAEPSTVANTVQRPALESVRSPGGLEFTTPPFTSRPTDRDGDVVDSKGDRG